GRSPSRRPCSAPGSAPAPLPCGSWPRSRPTRSPPGRSTWPSPSPAPARPPSPAPSRPSASPPTCGCGSRSRPAERRLQSEYQPGPKEATVPDNDAATGADGPDALRALRRRWRERYEAGGEREADFTTPSGEEGAPPYDPLDHPDRDVAAQIGGPGQYPFTRGVYPSMYRGRPWTIR